MRNDMRNIYQAKTAEWRSTSVTGSGKTGSRQGFKNFYYTGKYN